MCRLTVNIKKSNVMFTLSPKILSQTYPLSLSLSLFSVSLFIYIYIYGGSQVRVCGFNFLIVVYLVKG